MQVVSPELIKGRKVLLRLDLDVPLRLAPLAQGKLVVAEDYRLEAGFPTLEMCLESASQVIVLGHIGRPSGQEIAELSVEPVHDWLEDRLGPDYLESGKLKLLENLRFEVGENSASLDFAKELASFGDFYVNEAFASHHSAASTTVLPTLLPHAAGLRFGKEVEVLTKVWEKPTRPFVAIIGGVKAEDKMPAVLSLARVADAVLVGGKIAAEVKEKQIQVPPNVFVGQLNEVGSDLAPSTIMAWEKVIMGAKMIVWNGPLGEIPNLERVGSEKGTYEIARMIIQSGAESIIGGGDTVTALNNWRLLDRFSFVSTGGGAMLKFLTEGTLPTIQALS